MKELAEILAAWRRTGKGVLSTVVRVEGSAYRRPGARMLLLPDGERIGSVSGGCLEGDLARKAWWLTEAGKPVLRTYDTASGEDAIWEFGLGCNGVVDVLLERLDWEPVQAALEFLDSCRRTQTSGWMATVIRGENTGRRLWLGGEPGGPLLGGPIKDTPLGRELEPLLRQGIPRIVRLQDSEIVIEHVAPPQRLIIFGAGHDAIPLVSAAKLLGWHVTVADGRPAYAARDRFPAADAVKTIDTASPLDGLELPPEAAVVIMTHNYPQDRLLLERLLPIPLRYTGVLGPRARTERILSELHVPRQSNLYAPVGLDIGADTPEAIALSITAEIMAVIAGRPAVMLRDRPGPIYGRA
ncbi:MAG: XdhC family protein [Acidobacteriota bacterium]|nr:XdhC family protein [Acidobacteriota bacterium]